MVVAPALAFSGAPVMPSRPALAPRASAVTAFGPQVLGDTLTLLDGEQDEEPYGLFPPLMGQGGLTPAAEMWNGRLAMLGLIALVSTSVVSGLDILDVIDVGTGGYLKAK